MLDASTATMTMRRQCLRVSSIPGVKSMSRSPRSFAKRHADAANSRRMDRLEYDDGGGSSAEPERRGGTERERGGGRMPLRVEAVRAAVELPDLTGGPAAPAAALPMHDQSRRHAVHGRAGGLGPIAQIGVLPVHEEALVEPAQRPEQVCADQQARA